MLHALSLCKVAAGMVVLAVGTARMSRGHFEPLDSGSNGSDLSAQAVATMGYIAAALNVTSPCPSEVSTSPIPYAHADTTSPIMLLPPPEMDAGGIVELNATRQDAMKDCIVTEWTEWDDCAKDSDGVRMGYVKTRSRAILQPHLDGGAWCPPLQEVVTCSSSETISQ
eukprot:TRINITY_DN56510_c0_g1_i1.p1 TRINITY_DN56510_c0_g1~~TRINITY_DN56510_c0_g1_i1.p1  ORF type:complete len:168 (-),score=25.18 TRINITY_DN56510_c0_g1_i1:93-596(-)